MKRFVVTGAGGSIGSQLCARIVKANAERLVLVSLTEGGLYDVERKLRAIKSDTEIVGMLGSVRDLGMMHDACNGADVVIHAAAHKHVPICESNPIAAIENNVHGTIIASRAAEKESVKQFLFVSSDKAVHPASIMGATKRVAEMVIADRAARSKHTIFSTVRFGNVLDSAGSVLPLWREQLETGNPITLTDKRCERYFMSIPEACELIFGVLEMKKPGTFVFDMGEPRKMIDIAEELIADFRGPHNPNIEITGLRPGEKLTEELHHGGDLESTSHEKIFEIKGKDKSVKMVRLDDLLCAATCRKGKIAVALLRKMAA